MPEDYITKPHHPLLKPYIECYMYRKGKIDYRSKKILPRPGGSMIFEFSNSFYFNNVSYRKALTGIQTKSFTYSSSTTETDHLVVLFTPNGLGSLIEQPLTELTNQIIEPADIFGRDINELYQRLENDLSYKHRIEIVEKYFVDRISTLQDGNNPLIPDITNSIRNNLIDTNFDAFQQQSSLSRRQIERKFKTTVGVNMQTYIRLCRLDRVRTLLSQQPSTTLTDIGYKAGYYDQPHFSNDVKQLTGLSPKQIDFCIPA